MPPAPAAPPTAFRRRLLAVVLASALAPLAVGALVAHEAGRQLLSLSAAPVERVLDEAAGRLAAHGESSAALEEARLNLAQAELARRALAVRLPWTLTGVLLGAGALAALAAWALGRALARPVTQLARGMWAVRRGELAPAWPVPARARDELGFLLVEFDAMTRELTRQRAQLAEASRVAAWQDVARALAHELKNPLTAMRLALARLGRAQDAAPERLAEAAALLDDEVQRLMRMTQSFSTFARLPEVQLAPLALRPLLAESVALWAHAGPVAVELEDGPDARVLGDADALKRLVGNLVKNALEASRAGDAPVRVRLAPDEALARVSVEDGGQGVKAPLSGEALTRGLFTTKPGGSGLGLPISQRLAHAHGGRLALEPRTPRGTRAVLELPVFTP